jgi:chromosome partitioning related protein ParA
MAVISIVSTKGGVGKTTVAANIGAFCANAGLRVLLIDLDDQATLSGYFRIDNASPMGVYELITQNEQRTEQFISRTRFERLDAIYADDRCRNLNTLLLHAADGRLRLRNLLPAISSGYDVLLVDTQGARCITVEMAILASDLVLSPIMPEMLAARELQRGLVQIISELSPYYRLGIPVAPLRVLFNRVHAVSSNAGLIREAVRRAVEQQAGVGVFDTCIPAIEAFQRASTEGVPVHRAETRRPSGRATPSALEIVRSLACELFPRGDWRKLFAQVTGKEPFERIQEGSA